MQNDLFQKMKQSIIDGERDLSVSLAKKALEDSVNPLEAITDGFLPGVDAVGNAYAEQQAFLPELVMAGEAMKAAVAVLEPSMKASGTKREVPGIIVLATVEGDIHEIGKSLVGIMLSSSGFEVHDLGVDVPNSVLIAKARETKADIIGVSALLTTTMIKQKELIDEISELGMDIKVIVGGAPVTKDWGNTINADGYAEDAFGAVKIAKQLVGI
ncbi:MAG: cobalamin-binding protein [Deltaproteobacteria bacterium]|nr:MAG: cobalamin-binding protein [Deltaproteobacteria bacterium]